MIYSLLPALTRKILLPKTMTTAQAQAQAESKFILLTEKSLTADEMKTISENLLALVFDPKLHSSQDIDVLLRSCRMLIVNINDTDSRRWFSSQRGIISRNHDWHVLYKLSRGRKTDTDTIADIKEKYGCRNVLKYLPVARNSVSFIARLLSDHLPSNEGCLARIMKRIFG